MVPREPWTKKVNLPLDMHGPLGVDGDNQAPDAGCNFNEVCR